MNALSSLDRADLCGLLADLREQLRDLQYYDAPVYTNGTRDALLDAIRDVEQALLVRNTAEEKHAK